jgi:hypothetical protein
MKTNEDETAIEHGLDLSAGRTTRLPEGILSPFVETFREQLGCAARAPSQGFEIGDEIGQVLRR